MYHKISSFLQTVKDHVIVMTAKADVLQEESFKSAGVDVAAVEEEGVVEERNLSQNFAM